MTIIHHPAKRAWHPYPLWECYQHGMWTRVSRDEETTLLVSAKEFTGDAELYGSWMMRAVKEFRISCEHHLTDASLNKQAYIGHAACALAHRLPEYIVRRAWGMLTQDQRDRANRKADEAFRFWRRELSPHAYQWEFEF